MKKIKISGIILIILCVVSLPLFSKGNVETQQSTAVEDSSYEQMCEINSNPLSDVRVRMAIAHAIDMDSIISGLMENSVVKANSLTPNTEWKTEGLKFYDYNPELSKQLLAEAGWDSNYELKLVYYYGDQLTKDLMVAIQSYLGEVGIKCTPRQLEGDLSKQLWTPPADAVNGPSAVDWDLAYGAIAAVSEYEYYNRFTGGATSNSHTPLNEELDSLLKQANATSDPDKQKEIFSLIQKFENTNLPVLALYYQQIYSVESSKLDRNGSIYGNEQYNYDWKIQNWDIEANSDGKKILKSNGGPVEFFEHPFLSPGQFTGTKVLFDHLIVADGDLKNFRPQLADSYKLSEDGKSVEFVLKDGLKWHDGKALTAMDVKFSIELLAKIPTSNVLFSGMIKKITGYDAFLSGDSDELAGVSIEGNKIIVTFDELYPNTLVSFSQLAILPYNHLKNVDPMLLQQDKFWQFPIGSGPYKLEDVSMNNYVVLVPFESYHEGVAKIDEIRLYPSDEKDINIVKNAAAGQVDYAFTKDLDSAKSIEEMPNMRVSPYDMNYTRLLYFNKFAK
jgi:peptide/nickel transport system substrate-binding protein